jgi:protein TonB
VDIPPSFLQRVNPVYPLSAKMQGIRAKVTMRCLVNKDGNPKNIEVAECDPKDVLDVFGPPSVEAVKKWRFSPGEIGGEPVPTRVAFNIVFELDSQSDEVTS